MSLLRAKDPGDREQQAGGGPAVGPHGPDQERRPQRPDPDVQLPPEPASRTTASRATTRTSPSARSWPAGSIPSSIAWRPSSAGSGPRSRRKRSARIARRLSLGLREQGSGLPLALIAWTKDHFAKKGIESPRLSAEILLAHAIGCKRIDLYARFETPVSKEALDAFRESVRRHAAHEPLQYILGFAEFRGLKIKVGPGVFIPRPETEELVDAALERCRGIAGGAIRALDLCTGSGCIPAALSVEEPRVQVVATDASETALKFAAENLAENGIPVFGEESRKAAATRKAPRKKKKSGEDKAAEPVAAGKAAEPAAPAGPPPAQSPAPGGVKLVRGDLFEALAGEDGNRTTW